MSKLKATKKPPLTPEEKATRKKHDDALADLYKKHGVGKTIAQKLAFWNSRYPEGYHITHDPDDKTKVAVLELSWLVDQFFNDFPHC